MFDSRLKTVKVTSPFVEYADNDHGSVLCLLGAVDDRGNLVAVYIDDPQVARVLSANLFEWAIREELRRKYDGS